MYRGTAALFAHLQILFDGASKLLAGILNVIKGLSALLRFPPLIAVSYTHLTLPTTVLV